jgi:hypothetical protein
MNKDELLRHAIDTYGKESQIKMVFEEMAELQKEICKNGRGKDNALLIAEEIADVRIMLDQLDIIFDCKIHSFAMRHAKLMRLAEKLGTTYEF